VSDTHLGNLDTEIVNMEMITCKFADQWVKSIQAIAQGICRELGFSRKEKRCRDPRPLSTPTGEHLRVGYSISQLDTVKLNQTGIALPITICDPCKHHRRKKQRKFA
jgi:hypothetical protein